MLRIEIIYSEEIQDQENHHAIDLHRNVSQLIVLQVEFNGFDTI